MPPRKKQILGDKGDIINFYQHVPKKYLEETSNPIIIYII